jgi:hypothetical protein
VPRGRLELFRPFRILRGHGGLHGLVEIRLGERGSFGRVGGRRLIAATRTGVIGPKNQWKTSSQKAQDGKSVKSHGSLP